LQFKLKLDAIANHSYIRFLKNKYFIRFLTVLVWIVSLSEWIYWFFHELRLHPGFDMSIYWRAEEVFFNNGPPYVIRGFIYPMSTLILFAPIGGLTHSQATSLGLLYSMICGFATVLCASLLLKKHPFGLTSAFFTLVFLNTKAYKGEFALENVSALIGFLFALFLVLIVYDKWEFSAIVIGISLGIKPMLVIVLLFYLYLKRFKEIIISIGTLTILNLPALILVKDWQMLFSKTSLVFDRSSGEGVQFNSALSAVFSTHHIGFLISLLVRIIVGVLTLYFSFKATRVIKDFGLMAIYSTSILLLGELLDSSLSQYHYYVILVPLIMTVVIKGSPIRWITSIVGFFWSFDRFVPPKFNFDIASVSNETLYRAIGTCILFAGVCTYIGFFARSKSNNSAQLETALSGNRQLMLTSDN
jgi:arabinofuranan 3-O-arabinosyltransferase